MPHVIVMGFAYYRASMPTLNTGFLQCESKEVVYLPSPVVFGQ